MSTSERSTRRSTTSIADGCLRSSATERRPRSRIRCGRSGRPPSTRSTRTTWAPRSASSIPATGTGPIPASSTTRSPFSGPMASEGIGPSAVRPGTGPTTLADMSGWRVLTALAGAALIGSPPAVPPSAAPVFVPCPYVAQPRPVPPQPSPPARDPARPVLGGPGLATAGLTVPAGVPTPPAVSATAWLVADLDTGEVLGACGPHEQHPPASVQKLLLAETMLPRLDPTQVVEVTPDDLNIDPGSSAVGVLPGGRYTVETLWLGLLLESGNDTANVLARLGGGDAGLAGGIAAMNAEAHRLGADDTHAVSSSGLDRPGQFTSAYDLALIARADFARDDFPRYDTALRAQIPPQPPKDPRGFQIQNENQLLTRYPGALGGKTGFTDQARHTYVGAAQRNGRRLVGTLLGAENVGGGGRPRGGAGGGGGGRGGPTPPRQYRWMFSRVGLAALGKCRYIELHTIARLTRLTGRSCRGNTATTSPGRLVNRLAELTTTDELVSVRK